MDEKLIEYLKNIVVLEKSKYTQQQTVNQLTARIRRLGIRKTLQEPTPPKIHEANYFDGAGTFAGLGAIAGGILTAFIGAPGFGIIAGASAGVGIAFVINSNEAEKKNQREQENYRIVKTRYDSALLAECLRIDREKKEKEGLTDALRLMEKQLASTCALLDQYYSLNVIFPKYRSLVPMCSFYEYFLSGRCTSLTGHEGAYNIFETEVRFERIYTKLDEVISKLEEIKANQYILYDAVTEANQTAKKLLNTSIKQAQLSERIANNAELTAYYSQQAAIEANQTKWLMLHEAWRNNS